MRRPAAASRRRLMLFSRFAAAVLTVHIASLPAFAQNRTTLTRRERTLASLPFDLTSASGLTVSPDGTRGAYVRPAKDLRDRFAVVIDGNESEHAYEHVARNGVLFSPDSRHTAFAAVREGKWRVVVDGRESDPFDDVVAESLAFAPDGSRVAFVVIRDGNVTVYDGNIPGKPYSEIVGNALLFSPDGTRLAYVARAGDDRQRVVVDGVEGRAYDAVGPLRFSRDGQHLACVAQSGDLSLLLLDGNVVFDASALDPVHDASLAFSPDGTRLAFAVGAPGRMRVVVDGAEGKRYDRVFDGSITFSPDGRRVAYMAKLNPATATPCAVVVVDGVEGKPHDGVVPGTLRFSLDGRRVAYVAERADPVGAVKRFAVVDGVAGPAYDWVRDAPVFSPDGRHFAYVAERRRAEAPLPGAAQSAGFESVAVVDGTEAGPYPWLRGDLLFTPDGTRLAYLAAAPDDRFTDAGEIPADPTNPAAGGRLVFEKARTGPGSFPKPPGAADRPVKLLVVEEQIGVE